MKMFRHLSSVFAIATIAPLALAATLAATPAIAQADQLPNPDWVALLSDYEKNYWQAPTDAEHGGKVLDADTMKLDEDLAVAINHKAAENLDKDGLNAQRKRALVDSDLQAEEAMPDALGPVLGKYMSEGLKSGKLNAVADIFSFNVASTYASKRAAMHPRPYLNRAESSYGGTNDLAGLPATLDIKQSPSWLEHVPEKQFLPLRPHYRRLFVGYRAGRHDSRTRAANHGPHFGGRQQPHRARRALSA